MKTFLQYFQRFSLKMSRKGFLISLVLFFLTGGILFSFLAYADQKVDAVSAEETPLVQEVKSPRTVSPVSLKESSGTLLGTIISNETASVYPRRDAVVQDILVDIGDRVQKGQVLARLLPPGVEGESAGMIAEKRAMLSRGETDLKNVEKVAQATISAAQKELDEKAIALQNLKKNREALLRQAEVALGTTKGNEAAKIATAERELDMARGEISQMIEQSFVSVVESRKVVGDIFLGYASAARVFANVNGHVQSIVTEMSLLGTAEETFLGLDSEKKKEEIFVLLNKAVTLLNRAQNALKSATSENDEVQRDVLGFIDMVSQVQTSVLKMKESLEDAFYEMRLAEENLRLMESEQKKMVDMSASDLESLETMQNSEIKNLQAQVSVTESKLNLMRSEQQKMIEREKSELGVYRAVLQQEYAKSGNQEIRSPFTGVISKRFLRVGEMTSPSMPAFELVDVQTSLSKKAKREVQFGLPETFNNTLSVGSDIEFYLPTDPDQVYKATVTRKSPQVDFESRTYTVQARLDDSLVFAPNTSVKVRVPSLSKVPVFQIPTQILIRENEENFLWILPSEGSEPQRMRVQVLAEDGEFAEISGDLTEKTIVFVDPPVEDSKSEDSRPPTGEREGGQAHSNH